MSSVTYYGAEWCSDCRRSKKLMDTLGVKYLEQNVEESAEMAAKAEEIAGRKNIPVISFPDGTFVVEPSDADLRSKLEELGAL